jgi:transposase InsO family protein
MSPGAVTSPKFRRVQGGCIWPLCSTLVAGSLTMAANRHGGEMVGFVLPSDRGDQYLSDKFRVLCDRDGIRQSAGQVARCFDKSAAKSFWSSLT